MRKITKHLFITLLTLLSISFNANAQFGGGDADIVAYSFPEQTGDATITPPSFGNGTVDIEVAYGTDVTNLVATFELSDGATADINGVAQESGVTANDFTNTVTYTVTSEDGSTTQDWDVTVTIADPSTEKDIIDFNLPNQIGDETISTINHTVDVTVANGTDVSNLVADFVLSDYATANINGVDQESGVTANDFTNPVVYTVVAQDGSEQDWTVTVTISTEANTEANITAYSFSEQTGPATITDPQFGQNGKVEIEVVYGTDLTNLVATFELSYGATATVSGVDQESGVTANDFTNTVVYTVLAEDSTTTQDWDIIVTVAENTENDIVSYSFPEQTGAATIDATNHIVEIEVENGTDLTNLVATFTLSDEASATVNGVTQESGVTANDFSSDVIYTITAQNGDTQDWTVKVTEATATAIANLENEKFVIYPNPAKDYIFVKGVKSVEIYDVTGNLVLTGNTNDKIDISSLNQGVYFVKYENGFKKFIVKQD